MTDYFASEAGAGAGDGTSIADAWAIGDIVWSTVGAGGTGGNTIYILDAVTAAIVVGFNGNGVAGNLTVIRGDYPGHECTINAAGTGTHAISCNSKAYLDISGFTITGVDTASKAAIAVLGDGDLIHDNMLTNNVWGVWNNGGDNTRIYDNTITGRTDYVSSIGIRLTSTSNNGYVNGNTIYGGHLLIQQLGGAYFGAISVETGATGNRIFGNRIDQTPGNGILLNASDTNYIFSNIIGPAVGDGIGLEDSQTSVVYGNTVYQGDLLGNTDYPALKIGEAFGGNPSDGCIITNNIFIAASTVSNVGTLGGAGSQVMGASNAINNNLWHKVGATSTDDAFYFNDGVTAERRTFAELQADSYELAGKYGDPLLTSEYRPNISSPAYRAGVYVEGYRDFDGLTRHNPPTMGAYEYRALISGSTIGTISGITD